MKGVLINALLAQSASLDRLVRFCGFAALF